VSGRETTEEAISRIYRRFARYEAGGRSPVYAEISVKVAEDPRMIEFLAELPRPKRQPNLFFGAVQYLGGPIEDWPQFAALVAERAAEIRALMLRRATQTNEPARCAILLPALAALPQPLALIEVGASAGLCLLPEKYGYDYGTSTIPGSPTFSCRASADTPLPDRLPEVAWRAGLDLNPLDVSDPDDCAWLDALIWPGEEDRRPRLRAALDVARADPPRVVRGDLRTDLGALAAQSPPDATLVVYHTAVLAYLHDDQPGRDAFADAVKATGAVWLANESRRLIPGVDPADLPAAPNGHEDAFLLAQDGRPLAWTDPHARWLEWLDPS
jgi:hypothetical protein